MSDADDDEVAPPPEKTEAELEARQESELESLKEKAAAHIEAAKASAGKSKKAKAAVDAAEREVEAWEYALRTRHAAELEKLLESLGPDSGTASSRAPVASSDGAADTKAPTDAEKAREEEEAERAQRKKEKGLKKRQGRAAKEAEREAERERERLEGGPSARELELAALAARLASCKPPLRVQEVAADGNCLYRAVGDQLRRVRPDLHSWERPEAEAHLEVRALCAASLRKGSEDYAPFAELKEGEDFDGYCRRVELSSDWGGELELRALADRLGAQILVYRAEEAEPLALGPEGKGSEGQPLRVAYHRHYYTLGEHYNSVAALA